MQDDDEVMKSLQIDERDERDEWFRNFASKFSLDAKLSEIILLIKAASDPDMSFLSETCGTCLYFLRVPTESRKNMCRFFVPTSTSLNQLACELHVADDRLACGQWKKHPNPHYVAEK